MGNLSSILILAIALATVVCLMAGVWINRGRKQEELERHSITAEELHSLLASNREVLVLDVRQPLDLLAYPEIIPGARRIPPDDVLENPSLISKEKDTVLYCTCPSDKTSRTVLNRALAFQFFAVRVLKGGLAGWKENGYPVEPYNEVFHLYSRTASHKAGL